MRFKQGERVKEIEIKSIVISFCSSVMMELILKKVNLNSQLKLLLL